MYMKNPISWAFHGFTDVFFQLPAQTANRVELGIATRSVSWAATAQWLASSRKPLGGMVNWNQTVAVRSIYITALATFAFHIRVLEPGRMPFVTQVIKLIVDYRERGETTTSKVPLKVIPASREVCVMMTWDGIPPQ